MLLRGTYRYVFLRGAYVWSVLPKCEVNGVDVAQARWAYRAVFERQEMIIPTP